MQLRLGETDGGRRSREARPGDHRGCHGPGHPQVALALITLGADQPEQGEPAADASIEHVLAIKHIQDAVPRFIHSPSALQFYSLEPFSSGRRRGCRRLSLPTSAPRNDSSTGLAVSIGA